VGGQEAVSTALGEAFAALFRLTVASGLCNQPSGCGAVAAKSEKFGIASAGLAANRVYCQRRLLRAC
jgi:hypothetical protein